jgi:hypothetical protein
MRFPRAGMLIHAILQIMTAPFDLFNEFELNATCFQVRDVNHPDSIALG